MNLAALNESLSTTDHELSVQEGKDLLKSTDVSTQELASYVSWSEERYQRNLLLQTDYVALYVMAWTPGQFNPIHDHRGSTCGVKVLQGTATEIRYAQAPIGSLYPTGAFRFEMGDISVAVDEDIHQLGNLERELGLVTLHLYTPPLIEMKWYDTTCTWIRGHDSLLDACRSKPPPLLTTSSSAYCDKLVNNFHGSATVDCGTPEVSKFFGIIIRMFPEVRGSITSHFLTCYCGACCGLRGYFFWIELLPLARQHIQQ